MSMSRMYLTLCRRYNTITSKMAYHSKNTITKNADILNEIFLKSIEAVKPENLIHKSVHLSGRHLQVRGKSYHLYKPCYVVGFGKAVLKMAIALDEAFGNKLQRGVVTIPLNSLQQLNSYEIELVKSFNRIEYVEGAEDNIPDKKAFEGAVKIRDLIHELKTDDLLIVLVSGGGSALLPFPKPPITLEEKQSLIRNLSRRGADIWELNCVRKQISLLKGGGLAELAYPARVISLVLSDIIGDPLDFIASGPTTPNRDSREDAIEVIKKYFLYDSVPMNIRDVLEGENQFPLIEVPIEDGNYRHVDNFVIGNNELAAERAKGHASALGFQTAILSTKIAGDVDKISKIYAEIARNIDSVINKSMDVASLRTFLESLGEDLHLSQSVIDEVTSFDYSKGVCLIGAGEPTVVVTGSGKGGRNQQLALAFSVEVNKLNVESTDISFLSCGTDGMDGPTDAAGAIGTSDLVRNCEMENIQPNQYLLNNDSYSFFEVYNSGRNHVKIGHTGTNVMDIHLLLSEPKL